MQQSQQHLLSVRHKLPQANSILPSQMLKSEPAQHLRKNILDITAHSSHGLPLDEQKITNKEATEEMNRVLEHYYSPHGQIINLIKYHHQKVVFLNGLANSSQDQGENRHFGSICADLWNRKSIIEYPRHNNDVQSDLLFDDRIEAGNLFLALRHSSSVYVLASRLDYNTLSYGQWFYFKVNNSSAVGKRYRFYIVNMTKNSSMFGKGLKVSVCRNGVWGKQGENIKYLMNRFIRNNLNKNYFTLTFDLLIQAKETLYVAYNEPYTYTKLGKAIDSFVENCPHLHRSVLCRTPLGNRVEKLTITKKNPHLKSKKVIFILARAHPVETAGSFVMEGILKQLANPNPSPEVQDILQNYLIKLIPMINPDGVIIGNSRCNGWGFDLNRQWKNPKHEISPQIYFLKKEILKFQGRIQMFIDLHGHSKKKNVFAYGCHDFRSPFASREFPYLLSKFSSQGFLFQDCRFTKILDSKKNGKEGTARISLWNKLKIPNIFTIENSYCSASQSNYHYDDQSYGEIGSQIVKTICFYYASKNLESRFQVSKEMLIHDLKDNKENFEIGLNSESASQSEMEERIEFFQKKGSGRKNVLTTKSKTQKLLKKGFKNQQRQSIKTRRNQQTLNLREKPRQQDQQKEFQPSLIHSISQIEVIKKKYFRNLSPLKKKELKIIKCEGEVLEINDSRSIKRKGQSQPLIRQIPLKRDKIFRNNGISIVQIGKQQGLNESNQGKNYKNFQKNATIKCKLESTIKINQNNTIENLTKERKLMKFLKQNSNRKQHAFDDHQIQQIPPTGLLDFYYPRYPIKSRKNTHRTVNSKMQELIQKLQEPHQTKIQFGYQAQK